MPTTYRIPPAPLSGPLGRVVTGWTRRTYGQVPDGLPVYWQNRRVLRGVMGFERRLARWDALDGELKTYAQLASAAAIGCSWCLDFGSFLAESDGVDEAKLRAVPGWRESAVFSPLEREVMAYAEAMTATPVDVPEGMVERLVEQLGAPAVVELTQMVAVENMRSRFNAAAGLASQGFSASCTLPAGAPAAAARG